MFSDLNLPVDKFNEQKPVYKKTAIDFKRKYGIDFIGAPMVFKKDDLLWKLQYICTEFSGKKVESASYIPVMNAKNCCDIYLRTDINV